MLEWLKRHAWKACKRQKCFRGSNPRLSAKILLQAAEVSLLTNADWSKRFAQDASGRLWRFNAKQAASESPSLRKRKTQINTNNLN